MTKTLTWLSALTVVVFACLGYALIGTTPNANAESLTSLANLQAGNLIRGQSFSAVYYYGTDGFRYVFPNDKTYFTWYTNFDSVKWVSDADLTKIQIGGNVTYKPGTKMIKINSDPRVYVVSAGGTIHPIASEAIAVALYGANWNKQIDDVADGFFSNYKMANAIDVASMFDASAEREDAENINIDKGLKAATVVTISDTGFSPASVTIQAGTAVRFTNSVTNKHGASGTAWGTGTLLKSETFSKYFKEAGTYTYTDKYDASKSGTIIVQ